MPVATRWGLREVMGDLETGGDMWMDMVEVESYSVEKGENRRRGAERGGVSQGSVLVFDQAGRKVMVWGDGGGYFEEGGGRERWGGADVMDGGRVRADVCYGMCFGLGSEFSEKACVLDYEGGVDPACQQPLMTLDCVALTPERSYHRDQTTNAGCHDQ